MNHHSNANTTNNAHDTVNAHNPVRKYFPVLFYPHPLLIPVVIMVPVALMILTVLTLLMAPVNSSFAQLEIPSSFNPVGSGARALGMGGAFIAVADDATAASWNPSGLVQLELPEVSFVGAFSHRIEDNTFDTNPEASGSQSISKNRVNYLSAACPVIFWGHNVVLAANYQNLFDLTRDWDFRLFRNSDGSRQNWDVDYKQEGSLSAYGIACCVQITPCFSFGSTVNIWQDGVYRNQWKQEYSVTIGESAIGENIGEGDDFTTEYKSTDKYSLAGLNFKRGLNFNIGMLWSLTDTLTMGAVLKTPFEVRIRKESTYHSSSYFAGIPIGSSDSCPETETETLDMPMSYGIGFAWRFSDEFTASLDLYRTEWGQFVLTDAKGNRTSPISDRPLNESDIKPTHQIRLGAEYLFIRPGYVVPLRGGVFYDPAPAEGNPDDFFGFSVGSGLAVKRFVFDIAYQYRFGNNIGTYILPHLGFSQDVEEHILYSSLIVHL